jgi:hypothetical protein
VNDIVKPKKGEKFVKYIQKRTGKMEKKKK